MHDDSFICVPPVIGPKHVRGTQKNNVFRLIRTETVFDALHHKIRRYCRLGADPDADAVSAFNKIKALHIIGTSAGTACQIDPIVAFINPPPLDGHERRVVGGGPGIDLPPLQDDCFCCAAGLHGDRALIERHIAWQLYLPLIGVGKRDLKPLGSICHKYGQAPETEKHGNDTS